MIIKKAKLEINCDGTFDSEFALYDIGETKANITVNSGTFSNDQLKDYVNSNQTMVKVNESGETNFVIGDKEAIEETIDGLTKGSSVDVIQGNVDVDNAPGGVTISNSGNGTVTVNGETINQGESVTIPQPQAAAESSTTTNVVSTWDDGGPFTTDAAGNVYDRWGNAIWHNPNLPTTDTGYSGYHFVSTSDR